MKKKSILALILSFAIICYVPVIGVNAEDAPTNVALGIKPTTMGCDGNTAVGLTDGNTSISTSASEKDSKKGALYVNTKTTNGAYAIIDLGNYFTISNVKLYQGYTGGTNNLGSYEILYSLDGQNYISQYKQDTVTKEDCASTGKTIEFNNVTAKYIKLLCLKESGTEACRVRELEVYAVPKEITDTVTVNDNTIDGTVGSNQTVTMTKAITNDTTNTINILNVIALYNATDKLVDIKCEKKDIKALATENISMDMTLPGSVESGYYVRSYTFNIGTLCPYGETLRK